MNEVNDMIMLCCPICIVWLFFTVPAKAWFRTTSSSSRYPRGVESESSLIHRRNRQQGGIQRKILPTRRTVEDQYHSSLDYSSSLPPSDLSLAAARALPETTEGDRRLRLEGRQRSSAALYAAATDETAILAGDCSATFGFF